MLGRALGMASLSLALAAPALAQGLDSRKAGEIITRSEESIQDLEVRYLKPELVDQQIPIASRFVDAKVAFDVGDYNQAAILMIDVVSRTDRSYASRRESLYILAKSLYETRNYLGARSFFRELVEMGQGDYYEESVENLLVIAYDTRDFESVEDLSNLLGKSSNLSAPAEYIRGKLLFSQGKYDDARASFERALGQDRLREQSEYFIGVCYASVGKLEEARARFRGLMTPKDSSVEARNIASLATIALGRLAYEEGEYDAALDEYLKLSSADPYFDDASYEATWALVQLGEYRLARSSTDIILAGQPDSERYTEIMLLRASLSVREKDYDGALVAFKDVIDRYDPVRAQLIAFEKEHGDLRAFFEGAIDDNLDLRLPSQGLPNIGVSYALKTPREWLFEGSGMGRTRNMTEDLDNTQRAIDDSLAELDNIEARLTSDARVDAFPVIQEGLARSVAIESDLLYVRGELLARQEALTNLPADKAKDYELMAERRRELAARVDALPKNSTELIARGKASDARFDEMRRKVDKLEFVIAEFEKELDALEEYQATSGTSLAGDDLAEYERIKGEVRDELAFLEKERQDLRRELELARQSAGRGDTITTSERQMKADYRRMLAEHAAFLDPYGSSGELSEIRRLRDRIPPAEARIDGFRAGMFDVVDRKLVDIKARVDTERRLLLEHRESLASVTGSSKRAVADVALGNFMRQRNDVDKILLQADVGTMNVLFSKKEQVTNEINKLFQQRTEELKALQESFEDVR